jgi:hypothetical protein
MDLTIDYALADGIRAKRSLRRTMRGGVLTPHIATRMLGQVTTLLLVVLDDRSVTPADHVMRIRMFWGFLIIIIGQRIVGLGSDLPREKSIVCM